MRAGGLNFLGKGVFVNIIPVTTDPRVSALTKVIAIKSYQKFIQIQLQNSGQNKTSKAYRTSPLKTKFQYSKTEGEFTSNQAGLLTSQIMGPRYLQGK